METSRKEEKHLYYLANKARIDERNRAYNKKNVKKLTAKRMERLKNDPQFKLVTSLRIRLNKALKRQQKWGSAIDDLGCSIDFLKGYLESKFEPGMTWENHGKGAGKWNIDHIKPLSKFDLTNSYEMRHACHYTNLQPLWAQDNLRKGNS
jgi:hypothetical protein